MRTKEKGPRPEKIREVQDLRAILESSTSAVLADFRGLNVKMMSTLRKRLREADTSIRVVKNTLLKLAAKGLPAERLVQELQGPTALAYTTGDPVTTARTLTGFVREFRLLTIKGGLAEGQVLGPNDIQDLATLPPRPVLVARVVGGLQSPIASLVGSLQQLYAGFVYTLQSVADGKQQ